LALLEVNRVGEVRAKVNLYFLGSK
jgi:hypothetical protein